MITSRSLRAASLLALLGSSSAFAAAYVGAAYEGFDYTAGTTMDATFGTGTGWNATGDALLPNTTNWGSAAPYNASGNRVITTGGLTSPNIGSPANIGNSVLISGAGQVGRTLGQTVDSGTFYFSYLTKKTSAELRTVNFAFFNGTSERLTIGQIASNLNTRDKDGTWLAGAGANLGNISILISNAPNSPEAPGAQSPSTQSSLNGVYLADTPVSYALNQTFLVVGKVEFNINSTVVDAITLYLNPGNLTNESSLTPYMYLDHVDIGGITGFRMFAGATNGGFNASAAQFDEIRFGTNYLAVTGAAVPEPSAFAALAGLAGLAFAATRRRRA